MTGLKPAALILSLLAVGAAAAAIGMPLGPPGLPASVRSASLRSGERTPRLPADSLVRVAVAKAPFRATRALSRVTYGLTTTRKREMVLAPETPRPALTLAGIIVGLEPSAVLEGLPGIEGQRVVRRGDRIGPLTVRRIDAWRVVVTGLDTTWTLTGKNWR